MNTIQNQWQHFEDLVMPKNAPAIQKREMRRAFYAGAEAVLRLQFNIGDSSVSEDAGVAMIKGMHDECILFATQIAAGDA